MFSRCLKRFVHDESASIGMEYGLLGALVAAAIIGGVTLLGQNAGNTYTNLAGNMK